MELLMSPIGLMMVVINLSPLAGLVEGKVVFEYTEASKVWSYFYGANHFVYRIGPPPRPP